MKDLKILNTRIPDYDADDFVMADLLIDGGRIVKIAAPGQITEETKETIDAAGKIAAPGSLICMLTKISLKKISSHQSVACA